MVGNSRVGCEAEKTQGIAAIPWWNPGRCSSPEIAEGGAECFQAGGIANLKCVKSKGPGQRSKLMNLRRSNVIR